MHRLWMAAVVVACAAEPTDASVTGDACTSPRYACTSEGNILSCVNGRLESFPCRGPRGCQQKQERYSCDETRADPAERCLPEHEGAFACDMEGREKLSCVDGVFVRRGACPGCHLDGNTIACTWQPGDACAAPHYACVDGATAMECVDGVFVSTRCLGADGCSTAGNVLTCDAALARALDTCLTVAEGQYACSADGHQLLRCHRCRWDVESVCARCTTEEAGVRCD